MDLRLHGRVLWRFRYLVVGGLCLGLALAFFSYFRVDLATGTLAHRQGETWWSNETLLLTQNKSPLFTTDPGGNNGSQSVDWLTTLPAFYAQLANSDIISVPIRNDKTLHGTYTASQVFDSSSHGSSPLPFLEFDAYAPSAASAVKLAQVSSSMFLSYIKSKQALQRIPSSQRVVVQVVTAPSLVQAKVVAGRKKTVPVIVFLAVMIAAIGLVYLLENLRPRAAAQAQPLQDSRLAVRSAGAPGPAVSRSSRA